MTASYKSSSKFYSAWNYEQEIADLNRESERGWQLIRGGCFRSRFKKNPDVRYRYQLDFRRVEDMGRYIETFREQGWEYISSTFNGWHYFRKFYDPALPESAYEIFTDRESVDEMRLRWAKVAGVIAAVLGVFALFSLSRQIVHPNLPTLVRTLTFFFESAILLRGVWIMRNPASSHKRKGDSQLLLLLFGIIIAGCAASITLTELRPHFTSEPMWEHLDTGEDTEDLCSMDISYRDWYYFDLSLEADAPMTFSIVRSDGEIAYSKTADHFDEENIRVLLTRGEYWLRMSDLSDGPVHMEIRME